MSRWLQIAWPMPALAAWASAWALAAAGLPLPATVLPALAVALAQPSGARRLIVLGGQAACLLVWHSTLGAAPGWWWLLALALLLAAYPLGAWRDAPLFPTPQGALDALPGLLTLPPKATVLDAGCGTGAGLQALRRAFPQARLQGLERSLPWALLCRLRCPWAGVRRGDIWRADWSAFDLVYLFQRPESMARAHEKAQREMRRGAWLVSLEFEVPGVRPHGRLELTPTRSVWIYRIKG